MRLIYEKKTKIDQIQTLSKTLPWYHHDKLSLANLLDIVNKQLDKFSDCLFEILVIDTSEINGIRFESFLGLSGKAELADHSANAYDGA